MVDAGHNGDAAAQGNAGPVEAGAVAKDAAPALNERPPPTRSGVQFSLPWVVLGEDVVDVRTSRRVRSLPDGELTFAADGQHFALNTGREVLLGSASDPSRDYVGAVALSDLWPLVPSPTAAAAIGRSREGHTVLLDATARTTTIVARALADAGTDDDWTHPARHAFSPDGKYVTWRDGDAARVMALGTGAVRTLRVAGKRATMSELANDLVVTLFESELVITRLSTGAELLRKTPAGDFLLDEGGRTILWEEPTARLQTVVPFDIALGREGKHLRIEDDDDAGEALKYRGACGGGHFSLAASGSSLRGQTATLERGCTLLDVATVEVDSGALSSLVSHTPAEMVEEENERAQVCKRAHVSCPEPSSLAWVGKQRVLMVDATGRRAIFDKRSGRRVATLAEASDVELARNLAVAPDGKTIGAVDAFGVARLWDSATGKVLWSSAASAAEPAPRPSTPCPRTVPTDHATCEASLLGVACHYPDAAVVCACQKPKGEPARVWLCGERGE